VKIEHVASPTKYAFAINFMISNYGAAQSNAKQVLDSWVKPLAGTYKLNIDALFHSDGSGAAGVVLRDHKG
jgi:hypothetical protein